MGILEKKINEMLQANESFVLATILSHYGSTPRTAGTKMIVQANGEIHGTIGGGIVEAKAIQSAQKIFQTRKPEIISFNLSLTSADTMDMICGGKLDVLMEWVEPTSLNVDLYNHLRLFLREGKSCMVAADLGEKGALPYRIRRCILLENGEIHGENVLPDEIRGTILQKIKKERAPVIWKHEQKRYLIEPSFVPGTVYLFGAGHVSQQVAIISKIVDFKIVVLDDRREFANRLRFPDADDIIVLKNFDDAFSQLDIDHDSFIVIVTRGHAHDKTVLAQALGTQAGYIGMIGSRRKRDAIYAILMKEGFTQKDIDRVHSPIGLPIDAETPQEIAVSIVAELIAKRAE